MEAQLEIKMNYNERGHNYHANNVKMRSPDGEDQTAVKL
jgi:hypothetical protein